VTESQISAFIGMMKIKHVCDVTDDFYIPPKLTSHFSGPPLS